jgi:cytidine deaminase
VENIDHRLSTHGEEGAIAAMITGLGKQAEIVELWCMGAPPQLKPGSKYPAADICTTCCGKCRQQIAGLAADDTKIHYVSLNGRVETTTVDAFLPEAFRLPVSAQAAKAGVALAASDVEEKLVRKGPLTQAEIESWLKNLEPVDFISKTSQSMVVELDSGFYVAGTSVEDAAFIDISVAQAVVAIAAGAFGAFKVKAAWVYTAGCDEKKANDRLPLSALQVLLTFAQDTALPLHYLGESGAMLKLNEAVIGILI